jgi:hypothetical protein
MLLVDAPASDYGAPKPRYLNSCSGELRASCAFWVNSTCKELEGAASK